MDATADYETVTVVNTRDGGQFYNADACIFVLILFILFSFIKSINNQCLTLKSE